MWTTFVLRLVLLLYASFGKNVDIKIAQTVGKASNDTYIECLIDLEHIKSVTYVIIASVQNDAKKDLVLYTSYDETTKLLKDGLNLEGRVLYNTITPGSNRAWLRITHLKCEDVADYQCELTFIPEPIASVLPSISDKRHLNVTGCSTSLEVKKVKEFDQLAMVIGIISGGVTFITIVSVIIICKKIRTKNKHSDLSGTLSIVFYPEKPDDEIRTIGLCSEEVHKEQTIGAATIQSDSDDVKCANAVTQHKKKIPIIQTTKVNVHPLAEGAEVDQSSENAIAEPMPDYEPFKTLIPNTHGRRLKKLTNMDINYPINSDLNKEYENQDNPQRIENAAVNRSDIGTGFQTIHSVQPAKYNLFQQSEDKAPAEPPADYDLFESAMLVNGQTHDGRQRKPTDMAHCDTTASFFKKEFENQGDPQHVECAAINRPEKGKESSHILDEQAEYAKFNQSDDDASDEPPPDYGPLEH